MSDSADDDIPMLGMDLPETAPRSRPPARTVSSPVNTGRKPSPN